MSSESAAESESYRCRVCGREFASADELETHVRDAGLLW